MLADLALAFALMGPPDVPAAPAPKLDPPPAAPATKPKSNNLLRSPECCCPPYECECTNCRCASVIAAKPPKPEADKSKRQLWRCVANNGTVFVMYDRDEAFRITDAYNKEQWRASQAAAPPVYSAIPQGFAGFATAGGSCGPNGCN